MFFSESIFHSGVGFQYYYIQRKKIEVFLIPNFPQLCFFYGLVSECTSKWVWFSLYFSPLHAYMLFLCVCVSFSPRHWSLWASAKMWSVQPWWPHCYLLWTCRLSLRCSTSPGDLVSSSFRGTRHSVCVRVCSWSQRDCFHWREDVCVRDCMCCLCVKCVVGMVMMMPVAAKECCKPLSCALWRLSSVLEGDCSKKKESFLCEKQRNLF